MWLGDSNRQALRVTYLTPRISDSRCFHSLPGAKPVESLTHLCVQRMNFIYPSWMIIEREKKKKKISNVNAPLNPRTPTVDGTTRWLLSIILHRWLRPTPRLEYIRRKKKSHVGRGSFVFNTKKYVHPCLHFSRYLYLMVMVSKKKLRNTTPVPPSAQRRYRLVLQSFILCSLSAVLAFTVL